jgi:rfaE bifunctional protein kinase chain/domain
MMLPAVAPDRTAHLVAAMSGVTILVVGDVMLDRFIVGRVTRISPEAPVPVVAFDHELARLGGAANVAHNIAALGGRVTVVAPTGADAEAATLAEACRAAGVAPAFTADPTRRTTTKVRVVTERNQQVARIDYEDEREIAGDVEARIVSAATQWASSAAAIVVSDYVKGGVSRRLMQTVLHSASSRGIPVLVDPKIPHLDFYEGVSLLTPNVAEAEAATHLRVRDAGEAASVARLIRERVGCDSVLLTRGDQGMWLSTPDVEGSLPAVAREVADVTGAGDTVIATAAAALAAGASMAEAAWLANEAAAIAVGRFGPVAVSAEELRAACGRRT